MGPTAKRASASELIRLITGALDTAVLGTAVLDDLDTAVLDTAGLDTLSIYRNNAASAALPLVEVRDNKGRGTYAEIDFS